MKYLALQTVAMLAMQANAKTISVSVGKDGLEFSPANIKADKGDILEFKFYPIGHSVAIGDAKNACSPLTGAKWYSGIQLVNEGETVSINLRFILGSHLTVAAQGVPSHGGKYRHNVLVLLCHGTLPIWYGSSCQWQI